MKAFNFIILLFFFSFFSESIFAQSSSTNLKVKMIKKELSNSQVKELEKANNYISSGNVFMQEVKALELKIFNEKENIETSNDRKSKKESARNIKTLEEEGHFKLISATKTIEKGYDISYEVYKEKLIELKGSTSDDKSRTAKKLLYDAKFKFNDAKLIIEKLTDVDSYDYLSKQVKQSKQLKRDGIDFLLDGICLFIDCSEPVVEAIVENNVSDENSTSSANNGNSYNSGNNYNNNNSNNRNNSNDRNNGNYSNSKSRSYIYFTVQILAVKNPLPNSKIDNFYNGSKNVTPSFHKNSWKYLVGHFDTYNEAASFRDGLMYVKQNLKPFVVAFEDQIRVEDITKLVYINGKWKPEYER